MNIYESNETSFNNNGYGFLKDCIKATVTESLNGDMYLNFTYPLNGSLNEYLVEDNIIKCNVGNDNFQLFRIKRVIKNFTQIEVYALHIFYDLLDNFLLDVAPTNQICQNFGTWLLERTDFANNFTFQSDITGSKSARYIRKNPVEAIIGNDSNSMVNLFHGELERDNFIIKFNSRRGNDNHVKLIIGKNITQIKITIDITTMFTRVLPLGFDGLTIPENYVDSPLIDYYNTPKCVKVEFPDIRYDPESTEQGVYTDLEEAQQALRDAVNELYQNGLDKPKINIKIDWLELSKTQEYYERYSYLERVNLGDTITAEILGMNYETRVTKTIYNVLTDTIDTFEIGTLEKTIGSSINENTREIQSINVGSILESARNNATNQITSAMGGYVYKTNDELFIMDSYTPETAQKVWRWNINGLGYSSTGINGPYTAAITQDGQIVADFITTGTLQTNRIEGLDSLLLTITKNIDTENGNVTAVKTTNGFTFDSNGLNISTSDESFNTQIDNEGTYYRDGETILSQTTKDGTITKDMVLYGRYYYGVDENLDVENFTKDDAMFVAQKYTDTNGEEGFGHFYNGGD